MTKAKKPYRPKGKGLSHPAVRVLILLNIIAWSIGLYLYFNKNNDFQNQPQIANQVTNAGTDSLDVSDSTNETSEGTDPVSVNETEDSVRNSGQPVIPTKKDTPVISKEILYPPASNSGHTISKLKYTVSKGQAHFHNAPDPSTRRKAFINHWNKAVLEPLEERNGFIYIIYRNHQGQTSKGWLNTKDLQPLANR